MARIFLIDAFNFIFRAFHARQRTGAPPMRTSRGASTEAVYIFHNMLRRLRKVYAPEYIAVAFESPGPGFRDRLFPAYKANRTATPPELLDQIPLVERMLAALRIPVLTAAGYEADDVIGALARRFSADADVVIVSADKDLMQLVGGRVTQMNPMKDDAVYDAAAVTEFLGVGPAQVADLLALKGDPVDNIPGAPGIGEKGARDLIAQYGSVADVLAHAAEVSRKSYRASLLANRDQILLSKQLATVACDAPVDATLASLRSAEPDAAALAELYRELEFFSFLKELQAEPAPEATSAAAVEEPATLAVYDWKEHLKRGATASLPVEDVLLYGFLVLADPSACGLDALTARYLDRPAATEAATARLLAARLRPLLDADLRRLYDTLDLPLAAVLARMETTGIRIDAAQLAALSARMQADIEQSTASIYALAGHPFNINSPQQLGKVLFEELGLPAGARTGKTKNYSTAADVLDTLAPHHEIVARVLEYRQVAKLKSTYVDALPALADAAGRVHTTFNAAGAATGRLASANPNLQNIPVRTALGREIRAAFVPAPGWRLIVADYSQIELRLLAHFSGDKVLTAAFRNGEDIHTRTAAEVFGVPPLMVTPEMRRDAKAVNFGIVYGQTPFGLAAQIGVPRDAAERYIRSYFERYAGVKRWIDSTIAAVRRDGFTRTLDGRRRAIPDIQSKNPNARGFAERTAINTPLQGTAADLIKKAMLRVDAALAASKLRARMLLQVHDELVLEAPPEEAAAAAALVKRTMEGVASLAVPLLADTGQGDNWRDAK